MPHAVLATPRRTLSGSAILADTEQGALQAEAAGGSDLYANEQTLSRLGQMRVDDRERGPPRPYSSRAAEAVVPW